MEGSTNESKKKRGGIKRLGKCKICDDKANHHIHYGSITCYSCRAFFRRITTNLSSKKKKMQFQCNNADNQCVIDVVTRKLCPYCRYQKCLAVGMKPHYVMTQEDKDAQKLKRGTRRVAQTDYEQRRRQGRSHIRKFVHEQSSLDLRFLNQQNDHAAAVQLLPATAIGKFDNSSTVASSPSSTVTSGAFENNSLPPGTHATYVIDGGPEVVADDHHHPHQQRPSEILDLGQVQEDSPGSAIRNSLMILLSSSSNAKDETNVIHSATSSLTEEFFHTPLSHQHAAAAQVTSCQFNRPPEPEPVSISQGNSDLTTIDQDNWDKILLDEVLGENFTKLDNYVIDKMSARGHHHPSSNNQPTDAAAFFPNQAYNIHQYQEAAPSMTSPSWTVNNTTTILPPKPDPEADALSFRRPDKLPEMTWLHDFTSSGYATGVTAATAPTAATAATPAPEAIAPNHFSIVIPREETTEMNEYSTATVTGYLDI